VKSLTVTEELYNELKDWVVDPFDDTPEIVIKRALDVAGKAKDHWSPLDTFGSGEGNDSEDKEGEPDDKKDKENKDGKPEYKQQPRRNPEPLPDKSIKVL
jgi:hypothetical protein